MPFSTLQTGLSRDAIVNVFHDQRLAASVSKPAHGMPDARGHRVAKTVDGLLVYQKAMAAAHELRRLLDAPGFERDRDLKGQLNRASIRVVSDIAEGFEQKTDRHFARYLYDSKGGTGEIQTQLAIAVRRNCISKKHAARVSGLYEEVGRMLGGLIGRLMEDDWKNRG